MQGENSGLPLRDFSEDFTNPEHKLNQLRSLKVLVPENTFLYFSLAQKMKVKNPTDQPIKENPWLGLISNSFGYELKVENVN